MRTKTLLSVVVISAVLVIGANSGGSACAVVNNSVFLSKGGVDIITVAGIPVYYPTILDFLEKYFGRGPVLSIAITDLLKDGSVNQVELSNSEVKEKSFVQQNQSVDTDFDAVTTISCSETKETDNRLEQDVIGKNISNESKVADYFSLEEKSIVDNAKLEKSETLDIVLSKKDDIKIPDQPMAIDVTAKTLPVMKDVKIKTVQYGTSGKGTPLYVTSIEPASYESKLLVVFEIHGFEDSYNGDGWVLVNIGNKMVEYFSANPDKLNGHALYVVVSANPDGLNYGWTNNGPGRCTVQDGVDINRDFDYCWYARNNARNKTLTPFSCAESRALRDLVVNLRPNDIVDVHGWLNTSYGTTSLCRFFQNCIGIGRSSSLSGSSGFFSAWALNLGYCQRAVLVELPSPSVDPQKVINSFINLCANYYY